MILCKLATKEDNQLSFQVVIPTDYSTDHHCKIYLNVLEMYLSLWGNKNGLIGLKAAQRREITAGTRMQSTVCEWWYYGFLRRAYNGYFPKQV